MPSALSDKLLRYCQQSAKTQYHSIKVGAIYCLLSPEGHYYRPQLCNIVKWCFYDFFLKGEDMTSHEPEIHKLCSNRLATSEVGDCYLRSNKVATVRLRSP